MLHSFQFVKSFLYFFLPYPTLAFYRTFYLWIRTWIETWIEIASKLETSEGERRVTIYARKYPYKLYAVFDTVGYRSHRIREPINPLEATLQITFYKPDRLNQAYKLSFYSIYIYIYKKYRNFHYTHKFLYTLLATTPSIATPSIATMGIRGLNPDRPTDRAPLQVRV